MAYPRQAIGTIRLSRPTAVSRQCFPSLIPAQWDTLFPEAVLEYFAVSRHSSRYRKLHVI